jgi:hypothetical protein
VPWTAQSSSVPSGAMPCSAQSFFQNCRPGVSDGWWSEMRDEPRNRLCEGEDVVMLLKIDIYVWERYRD